MISNTAQARIRMELVVIYSEITFNDLWACSQKKFNLEQLSAELRAGSTGAQRKRFPGVHTQSSPQPVKHKQLLS